MRLCLKCIAENMCVSSLSNCEREISYKLVPNLAKHHVHGSSFHMIEVILKSPHLHPTTFNFELSLKFFSFTQHLQPNHTKTLDESKLNFFFWITGRLVVPSRVKV